MKSLTFRLNTKNIGLEPKYQQKRSAFLLCFRYFFPSASSSSSSSSQLVQLRLRCFLVAMVSHVNWMLPFKWQITWRSHGSMQTSHRSHMTGKRSRHFHQNPDQVTHNFLWHHQVTSKDLRVTGWFRDPWRPPGHSLVTSDCMSCVVIFYQ